MMLSLAIESSTVTVMCAWTEVRLGLGGAAEAHIACSSGDHAAEQNGDGRHDDTDESNTFHV